MTVTTDELSILSEALKRVREHAYASNEIKGDVCFFNSARVQLMIKEILAKEQQQQQKQDEAKSQLRNEVVVEDKPPVPSEAADRIVFSSNQLDQIPVNGTHSESKPYPGTNSPIGCGSNSYYYVDWSISKVANVPCTSTNRLVCK